MNTHTRDAHTAWRGGVVLFLLACSVTFGQPADGPLAYTVIKPVLIEWQPQVSCRYMVLTVSGPEQVYLRDTFAPDTIPIFDPRDEAGTLYPDGHYRYELQAAPDLEVPLTRGPSGAGADSEFPQPLPTQSGNFSILDGLIVVPEDTEEPSVARPPDPPPTPGITPLDNLVYDDLVVTGSACIGFDCQNGESFGFDTLKLKENNLRILFDDTSTAASYPRNDWRIAINDSSNGGGSYFGVEDASDGRRPFTIEAGAGNHALYVDDYGRVGLGTSTPYVELHVRDSDTPSLRLEQDGSGGWSPQTWDVAGNEANFFIRDVSNGSQLSFRIQPGTPGSTLCLKNDGRIGIGTWSPEARLHVYAVDSADATVLIGKDYGGSTNPALLHVEGNAYIATTLEVGSSRESKTGIRSLTLEEAADALQATRPVRFRYTTETEEQAGFIAEEVPQLLATGSRSSLRPMDFIAVLTRVVQEHERRTRALSEIIEDQRRLLSCLADQVDHMQRRPASANTAAREPETRP